MYFIYTLVDPRTDTIGYIGITNNPNRRLIEHLEQGETNNKEKHKWIKSLLETGTPPKMKILEIVDEIEQARKQEQYWIKYYLDKGFPLVNIHFTDSAKKSVIGSVSVLKPKRQASEPSPDGYYTRKEAIDKLRAVLGAPNPEDWLRNAAQRGIIKCFPSKTHKYGFFSKDEIDRRVHDLYKLKAKGKNGQ